MSEELNKLQEDLTRYREKKQADSDRVLQILTAGKALANRVVEHEIEGVKFKTLSYMPKEIRDRFVERMSEISNDDNISFDMVNEVYSEFMSAVCVEEDLKDPEVWIRFDEVSGALASLGQHIFKELTVNEAEVKTFRKLR